ncbi:MULTISPECIES: acyl-CoA carboxylase subunit epsilon [unclassified Streptomyces]|uniref:acyl-CoA carboxylase subunit epsilon n=1 Tax=unclassified Streptomyces TaxID=2593676 RepID=UPI00225C1EB6|nr:acyl-CoA carboxylase subunit epsilon [Streptomyces sp. NBC_01443]MCX4633254.1 acyl-CoA carboxylase subunit epsilon [Streptomyces sp. NBC_01443]WSW49556.1 acyl-CoA carboxylase subunit epsilon [Streptomyces sp. NBC_01001]
MTADDRTALALAAMRITKGNPTAEDVAALAVLLASRIGLRHEAQATEAAPARSQAEAQVERLPLRPRPSFIAPGAWAS